MGLPLSTCGGIVASHFPFVNISDHDITSRCGGPGQIVLPRKGSRAEKLENYWIRGPLLPLAIVGTRVFSLVISPWN